MNPLVKLKIKSRDLIIDLLRYLASDRPQKEMYLPEVMSEEEVKVLLDATDNLKHKAIMMIIYSAGLRISEVINLKIKDIDSQRIQIRVELGKGKKDRYTLLGKKTLVVLISVTFKVYSVMEAVRQQRLTLTSQQRDLIRLLILWISLRHDIIR